MKAGQAAHSEVMQIKVEEVCDETLKNLVGRSSLCFVLVELQEGFTYYSSEKQTSIL